MFGYRKIKTFQTNPLKNCHIIKCVSEYDDDDDGRYGEVEDDVVLVYDVRWRTKKKDDEQNIYILCIENRKLHCL